MTYIIIATMISGTIAGVTAAIMMIKEGREATQQAMIRQANLHRIMEIRDCAECQSTGWGFCPIHEPLR